MTNYEWDERFVEARVTYTLVKDGKFYIIENVPARVNTLTGEEFFSLKTVERLEQLLREKEKPVRVVETPVFEFA